MSPYLKVCAAFAAAAIALVLPSCSSEPVKPGTDDSEASVNAHARDTIAEGRRIFRYDTFGSEAFWAKTRLHDVIGGTHNGGVGDGITPSRALDVGLKVDLTKVPQAIVPLLQAGSARLSDPAVTLALLKADSVLFDGKAMRPDGKSGATLIPAAFGLAGVNNHTWTGAWGTISYWNAYVANTQMHGQGTFYDPRLADKQKYPTPAAASLANKRDGEDRISAKLAPLHFYQLSLPAPKAPAGAFNKEAAGRGEGVFKGKARWL